MRGAQRRSSPVFWPLMCLASPGSYLALPRGCVVAMGNMPELLIMVLLYAGLLSLLGFHLVILFFAFRKGHVSYYIRSYGYWYKDTPASFWLCVTYNLFCTLFLVWVLSVITFQSP